MEATDLVVEVRNSAFSRVGQVPIDSMKTCQLIKRYNSVGAWTLEVRNDDPMAYELKQEGAGLVAWAYDSVFLSGPMVTWSKKESREDPIGTTTFVGADDLVVLNDLAAFTVPSSSDPAQQTRSYDVRTGALETVCKQYVNLNVGPGAPADRREALARALRLESDRGRGPQVTGAARFEAVGELLAALCAVDATMGFDVVQVDGGLQTLFSMYTVRDRTGTVRMDVANDLLDSTESSVSAPTTTVALVAGTGSKGDRVLVAVNDQDSLDAQRRWGRRIETFIDQRSSDTLAQLVQAGQEEVQTNGRTTYSLKVTPSDDSTMIFNRDWFVGDRVGVVVDDQPVTDVVSEAIIALSDGGLKLGATVGDPVGYDWEAEMQRRVTDHEARIALLERSL